MKRSVDIDILTMPHTCSESDCPLCYLNRNNVTAFHIRLVFKQVAEGLMTKTLSFPDDVLQYKSALIAMAVVLIQKHRIDYGTDMKPDEVTEQGDEFHRCVIEKLHAKDEYMYSFVSFPKPARRGTTSQNPRVATPVVAPVEVVSDDSDDPTDSTN